MTRDVSVWVRKKQVVLLTANGFEINFELSSVLVIMSTVACIVLHYYFAFTFSCYHKIMHWHLHCLLLFKECQHETVDRTIGKGKYCWNSTFVLSRFQEEAGGIICGQGRGSLRLNCNFFDRQVLVICKYVNGLWTVPKGSWVIPNVGRGKEYPAPSWHFGWTPSSHFCRRPYWKTP